MGEHRNFWLTVGATLLATGLGGALALDITVQSAPVPDQARLLFDPLFWLSIIVFVGGAVILFRLSQAISKLELRNRQARGVLSELLEEGRALKLTCGDESKPPPEEEAEDWADRTETQLGARLGPDYIPRFRNGAGLPMTANSISSMPHRQLWSAIHVRVARLAEFLKEIQ